MDVDAGLLRALLADQTVEDIERVEQEVGVDLLQQLLQLTCCLSFM